jgi:hypothetical protein
MVNKKFNRLKKEVMQSPYKLKISMEQLWLPYLITIIGQFHLQKMESNLDHS